MGGRPVGDAKSANESSRKVTQAARSPWHTAMLITLMVAGGVLFCGPEIAVLYRAWLSFVVYLLVLAVLSVCALLLRDAYADHLACHQREAASTGVAWKDWAGDVALAAFITLSFIKLCEYLFGHVHGIDTWIESTFYFGLVAGCSRLLRQRPRSAEPLPAAQPPAPPQPSAAETAQATDDLHYVEAEDHYVKLVFKDRVEHKRARFGDVINGLGDSGLRVHKSFWVNRSIVARARRAGRRMVLVLTDGTEIPVGRSNERAVIDALPVLQGGIRTSPPPPHP